MFTISSLLHSFGCIQISLQYHFPCFLNILCICASSLCRGHANLYCSNFSICVAKDNTSIIFLLSEGLSLQISSSPDLLVVTSLSFSMCGMFAFIFQDFFSWIQNTWLTVNTFKMLLHCLLLALFLKRSLQLLLSFFS